MKGMGTNELYTRLGSTPQQVAALCQQYHIERMALFGSVVRADFGPSSDVDVLVEFAHHTTPDFFVWQDLEAALSALFRARPIDLVTYRALHAYLRPHVLDEAVVLYER
jgi:uncharacterized protein